MEPWLRGTTPHPDPVIRALFHSFEQVREDLYHWTDGLTEEQVWASPCGLAPLGFQLKHMAGSVDRLTTYARAEQLRPAQLEFLQQEKTPDASLADLLLLIDRTLTDTEAWVRTVKNLEELREVGRQKLPATVGGLIVHLAEHTQRHLGQAILTCKLLK